MPLPFRGPHMRGGFPGGGGWGGGGNDRIYHALDESSCPSDGGGGGCTCKVGTVGPLPGVNGPIPCSISKDRNLGNGFIVKNCIVEADPDLGP